MRKIYLLAPVLMASSMFGQSVPTIQRQVPAALATEAPKTVVEMAMPAHRAGGDTVWFNGFDDPSQWTASESSDLAQHGWSIGTQTNSWFWNNQNMGTSGNFARMRNGTPPPNPPDPEESSYSLTFNETIDLSDVPAPHIEFEQWGARFIETQAVQVSIDGGDTWVTVGDNFDLAPLTAGGGAEYPKPMTRRYNITNAVAANPASVMVRLLWDGAQNGPDFNYIMYGWFVDNVRIVEGFDNDVAIESYFSYTDYLTTGIYEFGIWPIANLIELETAVKARNSGASSQSNVTLAITVNGDDAGGTAIPVTVASGAADTARTVGINPPATAGTYTVGFSLELDGVDDDNPSDNVAEQSFQISEFIFARDNGVYGNAFPAATYNQEFQFANAFQFFEEITIYAIDVLLVAGDIGAEIQGYVLDAGLDIVAASDELIVHPAVINSNPQSGNHSWATLRLEQPYTVPANSLFLASIGTFGGEGIRIGTSGNAPEQTVFVYGDFGTAGFDWYFTTSNGMVRFNLNPNAETSVNVEEVEANHGFALYQNMPNPASGTTRIRYQLDQSSRVSFEVMDLTGKRVKAQDFGMQVSGEHQFDLNISDLAPGLYTYTLNVGEARATRKMIVN